MVIILVTLNELIVARKLEAAYKSCLCAALVPAALVLILEQIRMALINDR